MDVRQKLVELMCDVLEDGCIGHCNHPPCWKVTHAVDGLIASGVTVQEWISVDDRLPENDVMVIGYTPCDGFMFVGYYHEEPKYDWKVWRIVTAMRSTKVMTKKVTHWMPLPQPPKGE